MKLIATGCLLAGALCMVSADQVNPIAPKKGNYALDFSFSYFKAENSNSVTSFNVNPLYFVTDQIAIGVPVMWSHTSGLDSDSIGVEGRYYFSSMGNSVLKPFVGVSYAVAHQSGSANTTAWGIDGGAHYFVANNVAVTGTINWQQNRQSGVNQSSWSVDFGFTIFFAGSH